MQRMMVWGAACSMLGAAIAGVTMRDVAGQQEKPGEEKPGRVLYLTHAAGFVHPVVPVSEEIMKELAPRGGFEVTVTKDVSLLSAESLKPYGAVVFYTSGELPVGETQKREFMEWIRAGNGFVGIHSATDTFYKWPEYGEMIGGYFDEHPWHEEVTIRVEDQNHPATRHLGSSFRMNDEIYQFRNWSRDRVHVLLSLDPDSVDLTKKNVKRKDRDFGLAWTRQEGKGRVFYTALGHREEVWKDERFQQHLIGGIRWALGR
jgi:uncharacterized protein